MSKVDLSAAVKKLQEKEVIVYPTDTLYALGADIFDEEAVRKIFLLKKRPFDDPLPVAVSCFNDLKKIAFVDQRVEELFEYFLPGPLTFVLKKKSIVSDLVTADLNKVAIRSPNNKIALELLDVFGPLTATSANLHGTKTPFIVSDISKQFPPGSIAAYLDVGRLDKKPSTIVDLTTKKPVILREGKITLDEILNVI